MLQFLLDEHISPVVCSIVHTRRSKVPIESVLEWQAWSFRGKADRILLAAAAASCHTLVTYDLRTIPLLLQGWAAQGLSHHGVIFIDERTCQPQNFAEIADALIRIWDDMATFDWKDRVAFASRSK